MHDAGCSMVMVGFESVSEESLRQLNKKQTVRDIVDAVDLFHAHGIMVHGMFVTGIDTDTVEQADRTVAFAEHVGIDTVQLMIEAPLPGTRLYQRAQAENRIFTSDWAYFDGHHAVMRPAQMHPYDLQLSTLDAMRRFYSPRNIVRPTLRTMLRHAPDLVRIALRNHLPAPGTGPANRREPLRRAGAARIRTRTTHRLASTTRLPCTPGPPGCTPLTWAPGPLAQVALRESLTSRR